MLDATPTTVDEIVSFLIGKNLVLGVDFSCADGNLLLSEKALELLPDGAAQEASVISAKKQNLKVQACFVRQLGVDVLTALVGNMSKIALSLKEQEFIDFLISLDCLLHAYSGLQLHIFIHQINHGLPSSVMEVINRVIAPDVVEGNEPPTDGSVVICFTETLFAAEVPPADIRLSGNVLETSQRGRDVLGVIFGVEEGQWLA